jgi:hypothetical protein
LRALLLTLHVLGACVWAGGHLVLIVTALAVALVIVGVDFRTGALF